MLGELLKRGVEAYLAHGKSQPGWDIAVVNPGGAPLRVQVKAINWPTNGAVNGVLDSGFDVLVVVLLNGEAPSRYLIIPIRELQQHLSQKNEARRGSKQTLNVGKNFHAHSVKNLKQYEDKWCYVTGMVVPGPPAQLDEE